MMNPEELVPLMILEWIKGDKEGETEIIKDIETMGEFTWVNFHGGGRINGHVINEMMSLIGMALPEDVEKHSSIKHEKQIHVENTPASFHNPQANLNKVPDFKKVNSFGFDILDKAQRDSRMELSIIIDFEFISEDKIKMLLELYGNELYESLKDYIRQQISEDVITSCIEQYLSYKFPINSELTSKLVENE